MRNSKEERKEELNVQENKSKDIIQEVKVVDYRLDKQTTELYEKE